VNNVALQAASAHLEVARDRQKMTRIGAFKAVAEAIKNVG
jgi:hypothetical protein